MEGAHDLVILTTLAGALAVALALGWLTQRLGLSTLVGYMLAGVVVGPHTPGFVADAALASELAEIGVILLMFGVGMHFHPQELLRVWRIAVPGAVAQSAVAAVAGWGAARLFGWSNAAGIVFGLALAVASTVVLMRMLVENDRLDSHDGHVTVGWLIVEDLFTVAALVVLPLLALASADPTESALAVARALGMAALCAGLVWLAGTRLVSPMIMRVARSRSTELFTLTVFVVALGVAMLSAKVFHVSVALGAFLGGLVVGQSRFGAQAAAEMAPFRDVFSALFFVSVGMLFNPMLLVESPGKVLAALAIILIVKPLVALAVVALLRDTRRTGMTVAVGLAQIGEFSFILAQLGVAKGILPTEGLEVLVVAALISIALNPLLFRWLAAREGREAREAEARAETVAAEAPASAIHAGADVVIVGADTAGRMLARACAKAGLSVALVDPRVEALEDAGEGVETVFGDPGRREVLAAAGVDRARLMVLGAGPVALKMRASLAARALAPRVAIVAVAASDAERAWLREFDTTIVDAAEETSDALMRAIRRAL